MKIDIYNTFGNTNSKNAVKILKKMIWLRYNCNSTFLGNKLNDRQSEGNSFENRNL